MEKYGLVRLSRKGVEGGETYNVGQVSRSSPADHCSGTGIMMERKSWQKHRTNAHGRGGGGEVGMAT